MILQKPKYFSTNLLYDENLLNLRMLYFFNNCLFIHKNKYLQSRIKHSYHTRHITNQNLIVPIYKRDGNRRFAKTIAPKLYNSLPVNLKNISNNKKFANMCRSIVFRNYKYYLQFL